MTDVTLDDIEMWNELRIEHEAGTVDRAVASGGPVRGEIKQETTLSIDPDDVHTPDERAALREYVDGSSDELYYLPEDPGIGDDPPEFEVDTIEIVVEDARGQ